MMMFWLAALEGGLFAGLPVAHGWVVDDQPQSEDCRDYFGVGPDGPPDDGGPDEAEDPTTQEYGRPAYTVGSTAALLSPAAARDRTADGPDPDGRGDRTATGKYRPPGLRVMTDAAADELEDGDAPALPDDLETVERVREALVAWYEADHRSFPWRETEDPYEILVSEVMSQQTQLDRVVEAWHDFLDEWSTVEALAAADRADVVGFWTAHSLGYNNRAKYLHEAAQQVVEGAVEGVPAGEFPRTPEGLQELMGVGPYTANAVASFAFNEGDAVVDTNVKRVLHRAFAEIRNANDPDYETVANALMPAGESRIWNNAIMELGGVACQKKPWCDEEGCPWREWCHAYQTGDFTAPDVPEQPSFEGSRRQFRGRIIRVLGEHDEMSLDTLGHRIRVDYSPDGEYGRDWILDLLSDLSDDGLVEVEETVDETIACLRR
jgi:A/G-specific adenine glycosylase